MSQTVENKLADLEIVLKPPLLRNQPASQASSTLSSVFMLRLQQLRTLADGSICCAVVAIRSGSL